MPAVHRSHAIRLVGPWRVAWLPSSGAAADRQLERTVRLPASWRELFGDVAGRARFERRFNRPTGLSTAHRVSIVLEEVAGRVQVALNGEALSAASDPRGRQVFDVTPRLQPHNQLMVELEFDPAVNPDVPGGLFRAVVLEIEEPAERQGPLQ